MISKQLIGKPDLGKNIKMLLLIRDPSFMA